ncbi:MAG: hypothetical protein E7587_02140 [Ruminococcaceae bacterium]|nr:hypothetical protein [Oscillospiraceae bacterium]
MEIYRLCGMALVAALCAMIVKECGGKMSVLVGVIGGLVIFFYALVSFSETFSLLGEFTYAESLSPYVSTIMKILAVGYCVSLTSETCRELGEAGIASKLEILGKAEVLLLCLPEMKKIIELAISIAE